MGKRVIYFCLLACGGFESEGGDFQADIVSLGAGGEWRSFEVAHLAFNPDTNRLYSVISGSTDLETLISYDASTNAIASSIVLPDLGQRVLGLGIDPTFNDLLVNFGDFSSVSRDNPLLIGKIDLDTFPLSLVTSIDVRMQRFDLDVSGRRLVGLSEPNPGSEFYRVQSIDLDSSDVLQNHETTLRRQDFIVMDAVYNSEVGTLLVLFSPVDSPSSPNVKSFEGVVVGFDPTTGTDVVRSATLTGDFTPHSLAISPDNSLLCVVKDTGPRDPILLLDASTLQTAAEIEIDDLSPNFLPIGSAIFSSDRRLWIPNAFQLFPELSIAVYDIVDGSLAFFVSGALRSESLIADLDEELNKVFVASSAKDALYAIGADSPVANTTIDIGVSPKAVAYEAISDRALVLSNFGDIHIVSDRSANQDASLTHYVGRKRGFGDTPVTGLVVDEQRERVFVGNQRHRFPAVLETVDYTEIGQLPIPADAWAYDSSRNELYVAYVPFATPTARKVYRIDGETLQIENEVYSLQNVIYLLVGQPPTDIQMEIDEVGRLLWIKIPPYPGQNLPILVAVDLDTGQARQLVHPDNDLGSIVPIPGQNRAFFAAHGLDPVVYIVENASPELIQSGLIQLMGDTIFDKATDYDYSLAYYLSRGLIGQVDWYLAAINLDSPTGEIVDTFELDFIRGAIRGRMNFNPTTNRFAISSFPDAKVYLFDNPTDPARRPPPGEAKGPVAITGDIVQTTAGIEFEWQPSASLGADLKGWVVERRRGLGSEAGPDEDWIRLSPLPLPPDLTYWNDTTAILGATYEYRVRANLLGANRVDPLVLGPVAAAVADSGWRATIPEVTVFLQPDSSRELMVHVAPSFAGDPRVRISASASGGIGASLSLPFLPKPGTARLTLSASGTAPGTYYVTLHATDSLVAARVPLLVRVGRPGQIAPTDRVVRQPTEVTLTSDSDLDTARISVRGQLGVLRRLANPTGIFVSAQTPMGEILTATGVVAPTGEFTAEVPVPATTGLEGDWLFRATWPGSLDAVGGSSLVFNFPLTLGGGNKQLAADLPPDLGQALIVQGQAANQSEEAGLVGAASRVFQTLVGRRFTPERGSLQIEAAPNAQRLKQAVERIQGSEYALFYLLGDATVSPTGEFSFELGDNDRLTPKGLADLIRPVTPFATPLIVIESPYAAKFKEALDPLGGAHVFSAGEDWSDISFGPTTPLFSDSFIENIRLGYQLGISFEYAQTRFTIGTEGFGAREPRETRVVNSGYSDLKLGSSFTFSRALVEDRIPPEILDVAPTKLAARGEMVTLSARTLDPPFDGDVNVLVQVIYPDGGIQYISLAPHRVQDRMEGQSHEGSIRADKPGLTLLKYLAEDESGTQSYLESSLIVPSDGDVLFGPTYLLCAFQNYRGSDPSQVRRGSMVDRLWGVARRWYEPATQE